MSIRTTPCTTYDGKRHAVEEPPFDDAHGDRLQARLAAFGAVPSVLAVGFGGLDQALRSLAAALRKQRAA